MALDPRIGIGLGARDLFGKDEIGVLARNADRATAEPGDPADDFLVDLARKDHLGDFGGRGVGDAQPADEGRFDPELFQHRADLRPAAMDDDGIDPDGLQEHDILGEIALRLRVAHRVAAIFDHERLAGIALQIGQRLDERFGLGEEVGHLRRVSHRYHPAFFASRLRPSATSPVMTKGMTSTDSATLASICPPIRLAIGNTP